MPKRNKEMQTQQRNHCSPSRPFFVEPLRTKWRHGMRNVVIGTRIWAYRAMLLPGKVILWKEYPARRLNKNAIFSAIGEEIYYIQLSLLHARFKKGKFCLKFHVK